MVCLGFEPGPQDGRRRWNHGAMASTPRSKSCCYSPSTKVLQGLVIELFSWRWWTTVMYGILQCMLCIFLEFVLCTTAYHLGRYSPSKVLHYSANEPQEHKTIWCFLWQGWPVRSLWADSAQECPRVPAEVLLLGQKSAQVLGFLSGEGRSVNGGHHEFYPKHCQILLACTVRNIFIVLQNLRKQRVIYFFSYDQMA